MGEKFATNAFNGTGSMSVPIALSPGRSGFGPSLSIAYDSGAGNGPFGFGWSLSTPAITRKTSLGLPRYEDEAESDVFILAGSEDLVPVLAQDAHGVWQREQPAHRIVGTETYRVDRYRPRIEGGFSRIERWTNVGDLSDVFWRSISSENVTTWFGRTATSRIADPADSRRIFSWLICETHDDRGNVSVYGYKGEDSDRILEDAAATNTPKVHERNRTVQSRSAQRYLKHIRYGNRAPYLPALHEAAPWPAPVDASAVDGSSAWHFEVVFDYGEHDAAAPTPGNAVSWPVRTDPFSTFRAGFEVRTYRLCRRILMFHHFPDEPEVGRDCLVRSTEFRYSTDLAPADPHKPGYAFLRSVISSGHQRVAGGYATSSLPPVDFEYTEPVMHDVVHEVGPDDLANLPAGLDGGMYRWTDLHGEGIPGILTEQADSWLYKRNLSPVAAADSAVRFGALERVAVRPAMSLGDGAEFMDLAADGLPDLVLFDGDIQGLYEHDDAEGWQPFRPFPHPLSRHIGDPQVRLVDLDGDGRVDVLITEQDTLVWHPSLGEDGFGPALRVAQATDEETGPRVVFSDGADAVYVADLSGDGLSDLVRIRNGEVCYWPNLGYARFGAKVTMDDSPWFDDPSHFSPGRIRLADIDGSGTTDLIYLHRDGARLYFNQSGNSWSEPQVLNALPPVDSLSSCMPIDLLGAGTACLAWSSPLARDAGRALRYVDLMGGQKPHLLVRIDNNLGAETRVTYAPSTKFYLQDRLAGTPWVTRLPYAVHVVESVEVFDHVGRNRFVSRYAYHHGYYDGVEREFRGFGMVEQWDSEAYAALGGGAIPGDDVAPVSHVPPVRSRSWFHTGAYVGREQVSRHLRADYFREPGLSDLEVLDQLLPDSALPAGLTADEEREAARAIKGALLRQETYADDAIAGPSAEQAARARTPYTVIEQNCMVRSEQPRGPNRHAVFFSHAREAISYHYERDPIDPRIQHSLTLEVDGYGNALKLVKVAYGRRAQVRAIDASGVVSFIPNPGLAALNGHDQSRQTTSLITATDSSVTAAIEQPDARRKPMPSESSTYELTSYDPSGPAGRFTVEDFVEPDPATPGRIRMKFSAPDVAYEATASGSQSRRLVERVRVVYRRDDLSGLLPLGEAGVRALSGEGYKLAYTAGFLAQVLQRPRQGQPDEDLLPDPGAVLSGGAGDRGGYRSGADLKAAGVFFADDPDDEWWMVSGRTFYSADAADTPATESAAAEQHFYLPSRFRNPFGHDTHLIYDPYDLLVASSCDALGNCTTVEKNDYRLQQPRLMSDANRNRTEIVFDTLGMVVGTAVMGKAPPAAVEGDDLTGFAVELQPADRTALFEAVDPYPVARTALTNATSRIVYDLDRFRTSRLAAPDDPTAWQPPCALTIMRETHASAGVPAPGLRVQLAFAYSDGFGREIQRKIQAEPGPLDVEADNAPTVTPRWVGSGWVILNNKGKPVRLYEPFFTDTHEFEFGVASGVSPVLFYDPTGRVIARLHPEHTYEKSTVSPWRQRAYDPNDTCAPRNAETGDPRTDPDIAGYVEAYFAAQPAGWQTWHAGRISGAMGPDERAAAERAAAHADTPTTAHLDPLGRPFLTTATNRVVCPGHDLDGTESVIATRVELNIEGKQLAVRDGVVQGGDELGRVIVRYAYDVAGQRVRTSSIDGGARWMLHDVAGKPLRAWDGRGHNFSSAYDELRRPVSQSVRGTLPESDPRTRNGVSVIGRVEYGESLANPEQLNLRGRIYRHYDTAGVVVNARLDDNGDPSAAFDFKGNALHTTRQLLTDYRAVPDWAGAPHLSDEMFESGTQYDAMNRPVRLVTSHSSLAGAKRNIIQPVFSAANLLQRLDVWLEQDTEPAGLIDPANTPPSPVGIAEITYDAKGQRRFVDYRNGSRTSYAHDPLTLRLTHLVTARDAATFPGDDPQPPVAAWPGTEVQNVSYTYDPVGNASHIRDDAQQVVFFNNRRVEPSNDYVYDALYRLIQASGREHLGQLPNGQRRPPTSSDAFNTFALGLQQPGDGQAMGSYVERFVYDAVGNLVGLQHHGSDPAHAGWTRNYSYLETSALEDGNGGAAHKTGNRLSRTTLDPNGAAAVVTEPYQHDSHGNIVWMAHLGGGGPAPNMHWDHGDHLAQTDLGGGGTAYYVYDASGQRVRKVWEKAPGLVVERIYFGGVEIYRKHDGPIAANSIVFERETLHVLDGRQRLALVETRTVDVAGSDRAPRQLVRYQLGNHLGSVSLELDEQASIVSYEEYTPYGGTSYQAVRATTETPKRYRYTGMERDEETGLEYHGARYYAPWLGRWTSADPAGVAAGTNLYRYSEANPVRLADPSGLDPTAQEQQLMRLVYQVSIQNPGALHDLYVGTPAFTQFLGSYGISGPLSREGVAAGVAQLRSQWLTQYHIDIAQRVELPPPPTAFIRVAPVEEDTTPVLMAAPDGTGIIGPRNVVVRRIARERFEQQMQVADNIRGGIFGTIGYLAGGDRGSYVGAAVDGLATAAAGTMAARQYNQSLSQAPPPVQTTEEPVARPTGNGPAPPPNVPAPRGTAPPPTPQSLIARARGYFNLPATPTASRTTIVGVLQAGERGPMYIHSGEFGGPWGGTHRGNIPRGAGWGFTSGGPSQGNIATHVEGHAAAIMWEQGITSATLIVESDPCGICSRDLTQALPPGSTLTVISPGHGTQIFRSSHAR